MKPQINYRDNCRICRSPNLQPILSLKEMPFTDEFTTRESTGSEFKADINIYVCLDCHTVQTQHDVDVADYYEDYQYSVGASRTATQFMQSLSSALLEKYFPEAENLKVFEVGSGDGVQLLQFKRSGCEVLGYEPSSSLTKTAIENGVPTIQGLFNRHSVDRIPPEFRQSDIVLLSYTFDHLPDPTEFLRAVHSILHPERGILVIEVHNLEKIFERREYCLFEHEHSIYLTSSTAQSLLSSEGYKIIDFDIIPESIRRANSLLFVATPEGSKFSSLQLPELDLPEFRNLEFYREQVEKIYQGIHNLEKYVDDRTANGKTIAGYGAGGRGVMTLSAMNNADKLQYLVDKEPKGTEIYCPKAGIPVFGIEQLKKAPVDEVIVFSFGYLKEIQEDLQALGYSLSQIHSMIDVLDGKLC